MFALDYLGLGLACRAQHCDGVPFAMGMLLPAGATFRKLDPVEVASDPQREGRRALEPCGSRC